MKTLLTERLILRDWCEKDLDCKVHDEDTIKYLIKAKNNYAVVLKETNTIIGTIGLNEDADGKPNTRNIGIRIIESYQGKGLMSEALKAVISVAFDIVDELSWLCRADDARSQHIASKFGFTYIKTFLKDQHNLPCDFYYYTLKKDSNRF